MKQIIVNHQRVEIRENLFSALLQLAPKTGFRVLWVDALCIDQSDIEERTHQVAQMGEIYQLADKVIVWVGEADQTSNTTMDLSQDINFWATEQTTSTSTAHKSREKLQAVVAFCQREYWTRRWIIQEVLLARDITIMCGTRSCTWGRFRWILYHDDHDATGGPVMHPRALAFRATIPARRALQDRSNSEPACSERQGLLDLYVTYNQAACEEPKDRVFALHALALDCCQKATPIDYSMEL